MELDAIPRPQVTEIRGANPGLPPPTPQPRLGKPHARPPAELRKPLMHKLVAMSTVTTTRAWTTISTLSPGWLRSPQFDANLIVTAAAAAVMTGVVGLWMPSLFGWMLMLDLWLLGYHHVVSTFTRLAFDKASFQQHRFLVLQLPLIVLAVTFVAVATLGEWVLATTYLYWQWFHYTRQSYGIERIYKRKADPSAWINDSIAKWSLYLWPLYGILHRSEQAAPKFLGLEILYLPVASPVTTFVGAMAIGAIAVWLGTVLVAFWNGRLALAHTVYMLSHHIVFLTGYVLIDDITTGWLVLNVWHNMQYILLVWWFNNNRFKGGVDPECQFLSTISQNGKMAAYFAVCLGISTVAYGALSMITKPISATTAVPVTLFAFMVINFHHYVVDGIIWKSRKPTTKPVAAT